jgi:hypothetical protein
MYGKEGIKTHQLLHPENFLPLRSQLHRRHADLPPAFTPADFLPESAADDLMAEANPDQPHPLLLEEDFLDEIHEFEDPDVVVEGVETCIGGDENLLARELFSQYRTRSTGDPIWIVIETAPNQPVHSGRNDYNKRRIQSKENTHDSH